jgi:hypothetical protein
MLYKRVEDNVGPKNACTVLANTADFDSSNPEVQSEY